MLQEKWSTEAEESLNKLLAYLIDNWSEQDAINFLLKLERIVNLIKKRPLLFPIFKKNIRKAVITKQTSLYYTPKGKYLHVVTLFDQRRNPKKLKM